MSDYISREDALLCATGEYADDSFEDSIRETECKKIAKRLKELKPADARENRWIPVSEKLPKDHEEVLIYLSTNRITIGLYNSHVLPIRPYKPIGWGVNAQTAVHNFCSNDVIAWMPLPEPYKAERGEQNEDKRRKDANRD